MTIFIKPNTTASATYYILAKFDERIPILERVVFAADESEIIPFIDRCNPTDEDRIMFDGTVYAQTGVDLRQATDYDIFIYRSMSDGNVNSRTGQSAANQIAAQARWIAANMQYSITMQHDIHFQRFIQLMKDYNPNNPNCDTSAAELMAAAARYIRRLFVDEC
jgi:hypothetical protein